MTGALFALLALAIPADTTRSRQGVDYRIEATLDERTHVLRGRARLRYTNRSPRALDTLWFHQHLNAFRPGSAWARRELEFGVRRFQDLAPEEHAFERLEGVQVNGRPVRAVYPGTPDSTVFAVPLPAPLRPGDSATVLLDWTARLATVPRRQGRAGRHYDWAHWYPRIAVLEPGGWATRPHLPQGEFFGEFATYDVTLDAAEDQGIGASGVPAEGDPGWEPSESERGFYPARPAASLGLLPGDPAPGRKQVRWRAEDVHHFPWSTAPDRRHDTVQRMSLGDDGSQTDLPPIHALYSPGDTAWTDQRAIRRAYTALAWLQGIFGPYPYPQLTLASRVEPGATEFPMLIMNQSVSQGIIVHEVAHQWLHGILANNEWREAWLDEGLVAFLTNWFWEQQGITRFWDGDLASIVALEQAGGTQPIATPAADFRDYPTYAAMSATKPALVFRMLRELIGEPAFRQVLRTYAERHRFQHVSGADLERVVNEVGGRDLTWFFDQWIRNTATLDYAVQDARTERLPDGRWRTRVTVTRAGEAWMPVVLQVGDTTQVLESREREQQVEVMTRSKPAEATLDPRNVLIDIIPSNNRRIVS